MHILVLIGAIILAILWFVAKAIIGHIAAHYAMKKIAETVRKKKEAEECSQDR